MNSKPRQLGSSDTVVRILRRLVLWRTGSDIAAIERRYNMMAALNACHCDFLLELSRKYPEVMRDIAEHQDERRRITTRA